MSVPPPEPPEPPDPAAPLSVAIDPPLGSREVAFLASFTPGDAGGGVRRVWPGQPGPRCPWRPTPDGRRLELDAATAAAAPDQVATWLRFLSRRFLAPSTAASLDAALTEGLRTGHELHGDVVVHRRRVSVDVCRVTEEPLPPALVEVVDAVEAVVLDLDARRAQADPDDPTTEP